MKTQLVNWTLTGGIDNKTSSPWSTLPDTIQNCRYAKFGQLDKRYGVAYEFLSGPQGYGSHYAQSAKGAERLMNTAGSVYQRGAGGASTWFSEGANPNISIKQTVRRGDAVQLDSAFTATFDKFDYGRLLVSDICLAKNDLYRIEVKLIPSRYAVATFFLYATYYTMEVNCYYVDSDVLAFPPIVLEDFVRTTTSTIDKVNIKCVYVSIADVVSVYYNDPFAGEIRNIRVSPWLGTANTPSTVIITGRNAIFDVSPSLISNDGNADLVGHALYYYNSAGDARMRTAADVGTSSDVKLWAAIANSIPVAISGDTWNARKDKTPGSSAALSRMAANGIYKRTSGSGPLYTLKIVQMRLDSTSPPGQPPPFFWHDANVNDEEITLHTGSAAPYTENYYTGCMVRFQTYQGDGMPYYFFNNQYGVEWQAGILPGPASGNWPLDSRNYVRAAWAVGRAFELRFDFDSESTQGRMMLPAVYRYSSQPGTQQGVCTGLLLDVTSTPTNYNRGAYLAGTFAVDQIPMERGRDVFTAPASNTNVYKSVNLKPSCNPSTSRAQKVDKSVAYFSCPITSDSWMGVIRVEDMALEMRFTSPEFIGIGGRPSLIQDNASIAEIGFVGGASPLSIYLQTGATDLNLTPGVYQYVFVWGFIDAAGRRQQSISSQPIAVTVDVNQYVRMYLPVYDATAHSEAWYDAAAITSPVTQLFGFDIVYLEVYRTEVGGAVLYQHSYFDSNTLQTTGLELNEGFEFVDVTDDKFLNKNKSLDTAFYHYTPPSAAIALKTGKRIFCITADGQVWPSDQLTAVTAPRFDIETAFYWDADEPITAIGEMDGKYFFFTRNTIWVTGEAGNGALIPFEQIATDIGCVSVNSILTTPIGLFFNSPNGLATISRGLQVIRTGMRVEDVQAGRGVKSAILVSDLSEARFQLDSVEDSVEDTVIVFDYLQGTPEQPLWYVYTYSLGTRLRSWSTDNKRLPVAIFNGGLSAVCRESRSFYKDIGNWVPMKVQVSTQRGGTPMSFLGALDASVQLVGETGVTKADVALTVLSDYAGSAIPDQFVHQAVWTNVTVEGLPRRQLTITFPTDLTETCALALVYEDFPPTVGDSPDGKGYSLSGAVLRLGSRNQEDRVLPMSAASQQ